MRRGRAALLHRRVVRVWRKHPPSHELRDTHSHRDPQEVRRQVERVEIDQLEGRITTALVTPYPPGIPLLIPGERFNKTIVRYLKFARDFNEQFPGFETDIHGLVKEVVDGKSVYYVDCVR